MVEVTQADREAAASALDMNPNSMTWERLTAAHRTPTQIWQANRVAQAFATYRIAERERCARVNCEALKAQMEAQDDDTTPSSIQREKGLVWLEGWFDMKAALRAIGEPSLVELAGTAKYAQHGSGE